MHFLLALQFLTRIPVTIRSEVTEKDLARSMAWFPAVGLLLGTLAAGFYTVLSHAFPNPTCDLFVVAFLVIITGNMHGDALMDTADGFFSGKSREKILEIMKDSRVGSHGVMAGCLLFLAKFVLLSQIPPVAKITALILVPALGRWPQVYGATLYPYARNNGGTGGFTRFVGTREMCWASVTVLAAVIIMLGIKGLILAGVVLTCTAILSRFISAKIGGVTGDTLGAMTEVIEVLALVTLQIL